MKYLMIDEYRAREHNVFDLVLQHQITTHYAPSAQMLGPIGLAANRWVRAIPETDPIFSFLAIKNVGWIEEF